MTHILTRGDIAANWVSENPVLMERELGFETDSLKAKWGDGATPWTGLPYAIQPIPDLALYATLASPTFTGDPKAPTRAVGDNSTNIATTAFVKSQGYAPLESPALTGDPTAPTPATSDNDTSIATTAFVKAVLANSPALAGNPTATTPATADNDTSIATTAFVKAQNYGVVTTGTYAPAIGGVATAGAQSATYTAVGPAVGGIVTVHYYVPITGTGGGTNAITIGLPPGMTAFLTAGDPQIRHVGIGGVIDTGTRYYTGVALSLLSATSVAMFQDDGSIWNNNSPVVLVNNDKLAGSFTFIRAS